MFIPIPYSKDSNGVYEYMQKWSVQCNKLKCYCSYMLYIFYTVYWYVPRTLFRKYYLKYEGKQKWKLQRN